MKGSLMTRDYSMAVETDILERAEELEGKTFLDIAGEDLSEDINFVNKGNQGLFIEKFGFGISSNNDKDPDFKHAGIELKVCPLKFSKKQLVVKERTKICSINYKELIQENWLDSSARKKLRKILFVFYHWNNNSWNSQKIIKTVLWHLESDEVLISNEWRSTKEVVKQGNAHLLSESWYKALAPNTSGAGGDRDNVEQPIQIHSKYARRRAFSLKRPFVNQYWESLVSPDSFESIQENLNLSHEDNIEDKLLELFRPFINRPLGQICKELNIELRNAKNATNLIIKKILRFRSFSSKIKEFEQSGIKIKTVPVNKDIGYKPYEATSFPVVKFNELIQDEDYYNSALSEQLMRILFVPIHREKRDTPLADAILLNPFFWSPDEKQETIIKEEWGNAISIIKEGIEIKRVRWGNGFRETNNLPKSSETQILHMRPHAQNSQDRDVDPNGVSITKQSFWLNMSFVHSIISKSMRDI